MTIRHMLCLALLALSHLGFAADPKPEPGFIGGRIVGLTGQPINGAVVGYLGDSGKVPTTATGPDGRFKLGPIAPTARPRCGIYVDADGLAREFVPAPPVLPRSTSDVGDIALVGGRRYAGKVTDDKGKALPGVRVLCELVRRSNRYTVYSLGPDVESLTNGDGTYDLPPLPLGTHSLRYEKDGWATFYNHLRVEPGPLAEAMPVRMDPELLVRGRGNGSGAAKRSARGRSRRHGKRGRRGTTPPTVRSDRATRPRGSAKPPTPKPAGRACSAPSFPGFRSGTPRRLFAIFAIGCTHVVTAELRVEKPAILIMGKAKKQFLTHFLCTEGKAVAAVAHPVVHAFRKRRPHRG